MTVLSLHWFRSKQRAVTRFVLAAFCVTWLQLAAMPCVMALGAVEVASTSSATAMPAMGDMPAGMVMAPGEHCPYCPPQQTAPSNDPAPELCAFPHDPQVDSRIAFAAVLLAPPPVVVQLVPHDDACAVETMPAAAHAPPVAGTSLAVSFCRFLK